MFIILCAKILYEFENCNVLVGFVADAVKWVRVE